MWASRGDKRLLLTGLAVWAAIAVTAGLVFHADGATYHPDTTTEWVVGLVAITLVAPFVLGAISDRWWIAPFAGAGLLIWAYIAAGYCSNEVCLTGPEALRDSLTAWLWFSGIAAAIAALGVLARRGAERTRKRGDLR